MIVREASLADEAAVISLWRRCGLTTSYNDPSVDFRTALAGPSSTVLVTNDEFSKVVGSVMTGHDGHRGWMYYVSSDPDVRGRNVGKRMVEAAEEWLRARNVVKVQLLVRPSNEGVVNFYQRLAYEETPRIVMAKWLDEPMQTMSEK